MSPPHVLISLQVYSSGILTHGDSSCEPKGEDSSSPSPSAPGFSPGQRRWVHKNSARCPPDFLRAEQSCSVYRQSCYALV